MPHCFQKIALFGRLYGSIAWLRRKFYQKGICSIYHSESFHVIGIGNLRVGGTGKTPHTEFLLKHLTADFRLATLSRGYGRKSKGFLCASLLTEENRTAATLGDEPLQMFRKFPEVSVCVCEKRQSGLERLAGFPNPPQVVLLDDNYQHLQVRPDCQLLLTEYARPYFDDMPVPEGRLREFPAAATAADIIVVTKCPPGLTAAEAELFVQKLNPTPQQDVFFSTFSYSVPHAETAPANSTTLTENTPVALITGIANPTPLLQHLQKHHQHVTLYKFRDHHDFSISELENIFEKEKKKAPDCVFFSTEKDISRLQTNNTKKIVSLQPFFSIPIEVKILFGKENQLITKIKSYVTED